MPAIFEGREAEEMLLAGMIGIARWPCWTSRQDCSTVASFAARHFPCLLHDSICCTFVKRVMYAQRLASRATLINQLLNAAVNIIPLFAGWSFLIMPQPTTSRCFIDCWYNNDTVGRLRSIFYSRNNIFCFCYFLNLDKIEIDFWCNNESIRYILQFRKKMKRIAVWSGRKR